MKVAKLFAPALAAMMISAPAMAQQMGGGQQMGAPSVDDQVSQIDEMVDLDAGQEEEMRSLMNEMQNGMSEKRQEIQALQQQLSEHVGPDYDEAAIRADSQKLGDMTADMMAERLLMQSKMEAVFTQEQRDTLDEQVAKQRQQMQQMQEQMRQQQQNQSQGGGQ
ncbi:Spy/CpxP family protein refolding chaperone [Aidingimonas lacisalsi]|uniref:Spy/CpxP family protein refolding chaperone n=1 Tax=Aidingimonas lacisalsi TaxID=2604086 RepID=UPI0011D2C0A0|nr:Spy/CpxP family protein refolding chaperone [Aidingimonas lacisalsi]